MAAVVHVAPVVHLVDVAPAILAAAAANKVFLKKPLTFLVRGFFFWFVHIVMVARQGG